MGSNDNWFDNNVRLDIKDGKKVRFWDERRVGEQPLRERFPRLYVILSGKENVLNELGKWEGGACIWNLKWGQEMLLELINNSQQKGQGSSVSDNWVWSQDSLQVYTVRLSVHL